MAAARVLRASLLLAALVAATAGVEPSTSPPGGLTPEQTPQFVLFTHDDAIGSDSYYAVRQVADGSRQVNGCPLSATLFVKVDGTECDLLSELYQSGLEVADHSVTHSSFLEMDADGIQEELLGARSRLAECGLPEGAVVGARTPYLRINPTVRRILQENGFLYDSSIRDFANRGGSLTTDMSNREWPWDMGYGIPNCADGGSVVQQCSEGESYPGLFEVPVWVLNALGGEYHMNYGDDGGAPVFDILKANFDAAYGGNRAPMPIFVHTPWIQDFTDDLLRFVEYAGSKPDVYFVTIRQLLAWMQNPIPVGQLTPQLLGCGNEGGAGPAAPVGPFSAGGDGGDGGLAWSDAPVPAPAPQPSGADEGPTPAPAPGPGPASAEQLPAPATA